MYFGSGAYYYDLEAYYAYSVNGYDLNLIAQLQLNNPMGAENWRLPDFPGDLIDYEIQRGLSGSTNPVYVKFLSEAGLDTSNVYNYEPNYPDAMMTEHEDLLDTAKSEFYKGLLAFHDGNMEIAYDWLLITKESLGVPDE